MSPARRSQNAPTAKIFRHTECAVDQGRRQTGWIHLGRPTTAVRTSQRIDGHRSSHSAQSTHFYRVSGPSCGILEQAARPRRNSSRYSATVASWGRQGAQGGILRGRGGGHQSSLRRDSTQPTGLTQINASLHGWNSYCWDQLARMAFPLGPCWATRPEFCRRHCVRGALGERLVVREVKNASLAPKIALCPGSAPRKRVDRPYPRFKLAIWACRGARGGVSDRRQLQCDCHHHADMD
jgi:hypothetical protein